MECFLHDMGPVVRMARPENPNEIDEYVNPFCTKLDEIGSFQSYCIGHFEHEWLDALGRMIAEGRVPITDAPRVDDPTELRHMDSGYIHRMEFSRLDRGTSMRMHRIMKPTDKKRCVVLLMQQRSTGKIDFERT